MGLFHYTFSDDLKNALRPAIPYGDQRGLEVFDRYAITPLCPQMVGLYEALWRISLPGPEQLS